MKAYCRSCNKYLNYCDCQDKTSEQKELGIKQQKELSKGASNLGTFDNTVKAEWLPDGRDMKLLESVSFTDKSGKTWVAPAGSIINGANIPRFFWRVIGSPFVGRYRRSTVIHDVYCQTRSETCKLTHAMFDEAMEADGVDEVKRSTMNNAVVTFGPKW